MKRFLNISSRIILYLLLVVGCLGVFTYYALQWSEVQTSLSQKGAKWLTEKLGSNVSVGSVRFSWFDELTLEDVVVKDLNDRDMFYLREVYINMKSNFEFSREEFIRFDNNLDFVLLKEPDVKLIREDNGELNVDRWIRKIASLSKRDSLKPIDPNNIPFTIDEAVIQNGSFEMVDPRKEPFDSNMFDYYNFKINSINANLKDFFIQGDTIIFKGKNIKGYNKRSDLTIHEINTDFFYSRDQMLLSKLSARINNSYVADFLGFYYDSPADFSEFNDKVKMRANLQNCELDAQDLGRFAPDLYAYNENYRLSGDLTGTVRNLTIKNTDLKFGQKSFLSGTMHFEGLPSIYDTKYDLEFGQSEIFEKDARQYSGEKYYDQYVKKFGTVSFNGSFVGKYDDFYTDAHAVSTTMGMLDGKLKFNLDKRSRKPIYNGDVNTKELNLALITNNENLLQRISFKGQIAGEGTTLGDAAVKLDGKVDRVYFNGYDFQNIDVNGVLVKSKFDGYIKIDDDNLNTQITGKIDFNKAQNEFHIIGILERANLKALGYVKEDYILQTNFNLDFDGNDLDNWLGSAKFNNMYIRGGERNLVVDRLRFSSKMDNEKRVLGVNSEFLDGEISGPFVPSELLRDLNKLLKEYKLFFNGTEDQRTAYYRSKKLNDTLSNYQADYTINFKDSENLFAFFQPEVYVSKGSNVKGKFKIQNTSLFTSYGVFDTLKYAGNTFVNNELDFYSSKKSFSPEVLTSVIISSEEQVYVNNVNTEKFELNGSWGDSKVINFDSFVKQKDTENSAQVFGQLKFLPDGFDLKINPRNSKLHLLDSDWRFDKDNLVNFYGREVCFDQFEIRNQNQGIALNGTISENEDEALSITVEDFDLRTLEPLADLNLRGIANGDASIAGIYNNLQIVSNLYINEVVYKDILVGNVAAEVSWDKAVEKMAINGNINRINQEIFRVSGTYDPKNSDDALDLKAYLRRAEMEILGVFVEDIFTGIKGYADGELDISGIPKDPIIRGKVAVSQGQLKLNATGTQLYFDDDIIFNEEGFVADKDGFEVRDAKENGNIATLKGGIFNGGGGNFMLGLHAYIQNKNGFRLLDLKNRDSDVFYGSAYAIGDLHLTGSFEDILIVANLTSKPNTKITIPLDAATTVDVSEEAIPFNPFSPTEDETLDGDINGEQAKTQTKVNTNGLKMVFNLRLTPDAECEIIFDRQNNDKLNAFGNGRLTIEYDTRGTFTMSGPYVVTSGKYDFSFQNLASLRKFDILDGSRITWSGDPYNAMLDVKAAYLTTFALGDIPQINLEDASEGNSRFPMSVVIQLNGQLESPVIDYNLSFDQNQLPVRYQTQILAFEQKLRNDEQALSRNVSSILALNQFFPEGGGADVFNQQFLIDNLSSMLSNQIGNLANKLDPNLELGVLIGDFRQNLMNNLQLNFSYKFLNNRVKLSGKSSFSNTSVFLDNGTTGLTSTLNQGLLTVGGEVEWLLSDDGVWKLRGYSRSVPNVTLTSASAAGNVVVSGINVIFSRNFNSIFKEKKEKAPTKIPLGVGRKEDNPELSLNKK